MDKSADFGFADPGSSPGGATSSKQVEVDCGPQVPKTQPELYLALMRAMEDAAKHMRRYLETGDVDDMRRAANSWMILRTSQGYSQCGQMWGAVIGGDRPFSEELREKADEWLKEISAERG